MTYKIILTDVDETVLDFCNPMEDWLKDCGHLAVPGLRDTYDFVTTMGITDLTEVDAIVADFQHSDVMGRLPPEPDALEVLPDLYRDGWRFVAITACSPDPEVIKARRRNLEEAFGFHWDAVHCTGHGRPKRPYLEAYRPTIWVEDHQSNAMVGSKVGHFSYLITRPYNWSPVPTTGVNRVDTWHEIAARL